MSLYGGSTAELIRQVHKWQKDSRRRTRKWRIEARECYGFYSGLGQWSDDDKEVLKESQRPCVTFNRTGPTIDGVIGAESANRQETRYLPRTVSEQANDAPINEQYTSVAQWIRDECDAEDEESHAFQDLLIAGMGWTDTWIDFTEEADGKLMIERAYPLEIFYDPDARKRNLSDARRVQRVKMMPLDDIKATWPGKRIREPWAGDIRTEVPAQEPHDADEAEEYKNDQGASDSPRDEAPVIETQWYELVTFLRVENPETGQVEFLTREQHRLLEEETGKIAAVPQKRKVFYRCFSVGKTLLEKSELHRSPDGRMIPGFTLRCMTGKYDESEKIWLGLVSSMKDPQRWSNKFFSQIQDIVNANAKGGIIAESDVFSNPRDAQRDWASADRIVFVNPGALRDGKIKERNPPNFPAALNLLLQTAIQGVRETSGVPVELQGMAERTQSGVVENARIRQGLAQLAIFFNSLRRYRKDQGRVLFHMIDLYVPDETLVRIVGQDRYIAFKKDRSIARYDVIVDQAPTSPNFKEEVWAGLQVLLPVMMKAGIPIPPDVIDFSPLPYSVAAKIKAFYAAQQPSEEQKQLQARGQEAEVEKTEAEGTLAEAKAQQAIMTGIGVLLARQNDAKKTGLERDHLQLEGAGMILEALEKLGEAENERSESKSKS